MKLFSLLFLISEAKKFGRTQNAKATLDFLRKKSQACEGDIPHGVTKGSKIMRIICDPGYDLQRKTKYLCKKTPGTKKKRIQPKPICVPRDSSSGAEPETTIPPRKTKSVADEEKWWPKENCPQPVKGGVEVRMLDQSYHDHRGFGWILEIDPDPTKVQHPYTIVLELDELEIGGNLQTWNYQFSGFFPNLITMFTKIDSDIHGSSAIIAGSSFRTKKVPKVHVIQGVHREPHCYRQFARRGPDNSMQELDTAVAEMYDWFKPVGSIELPADVTQVVYNAIDGTAGIIV